MSACITHAGLQPAGFHKLQRAARHPAILLHSAYQPGKRWDALSTAHPLVASCTFSSIQPWPDAHMRQLVRSMHARCSPSAAMIRTLPRTATYRQAITGLGTTPSWV